MTKIAFILMIISQSLFAQNNIEVSNWLKENIYKKLKNVQINNIILEKSLLDSINLKDYYIEKDFSDITFNNDSLKDFAISIKQVYEKRKGTNAKFASISEYRLLLLFVQIKPKVYQLVCATNKLLNQFTEGFDGTIQIICKNNQLIIREMGDHIGTEWISDLYFKYNPEKQNLYFVKAIASSANLSNPDMPVIKKMIYERKPIRPTSINSTSYYDYFPFGFTDEFP